MAEAIAGPPGDGGVSTFTLAPAHDFLLLALSFVVDLSGSAATDDVLVELLNQSGGLIAGEAPGAAQVAGSVVTYSLSPYLNPCDAGSWTSGRLTPDTFASVPLTESCQIVISAVDSTTGAADSSAVIASVWYWVDSGGASVRAVVPPYTAQSFALQAA